MPESTELTDGVITLRPWTIDDARFLLDACRDAEIRRFWLRQTLETTDDALAMSETAVVRWAAYRNSNKMKRLPFLIAETASGAPSGLCGVDEWFADDSVQIGYFLTAAARGRGYATRSVQLLTSWLFALGAARIFATVNTRNVASIAVLHRAGFAHETTIDGHGTHEGQLYDLAFYTKAAPG